MRRLISCALALALVTLAVAGCAPAPTTPVTPQPSTTGTTPPSTPGTPSGQPTGTPSVSPTSTEPITQPVDLNVYFIYKEKLQAVHRTAPAGTKGVLKAAVTELLAGPTAKEKAAGLSSPIPAGTKLRSVTISGNVATVDLDKTYVSGGGSLSMLLRVAQVVFTATQFRSVAAVRFAVDGVLVTTIGGEGVIVDKAQTRRNWQDQCPAIFVDSPAWGGTLREGDTITGTANVFEATFKVQLRDSFKTLLFDTTVHATSGTGTRGDWSARATLNNSTASKGTLRVFDNSAKDGKPENVINIPVVLAR